MMAYLASRGLGVVRQTLFNAIFGTGPEANAYYAAFRLPDTLFSLIAGGALIQAFVPVFISWTRRNMAFDEPGLQRAAGYTHWSDTDC